ncbi:MAG TPA: biotin/lipoyl-binding protein [Acidimicrobiales bacterium]
MPPDPDPTSELRFDEEGELLPDEVDPRRKKRRLTILAVAVVVLAGGGTGLGLWLSGGTPASGIVIENQTVSATTGTIQQSVSASGTLEPANEANLNFAVSGTVTAVDVKAGQQVTSGQVLATVGTTALQEDVDAAQAQVTAADDKLSSDESSDAGASQVDSDEASVTSAESSLSTAQTNLTDASLTSTITGTVAAVALTVGQAVSGSGGGGGAGDDAAANDDSSSSSSGQITVIGTDSYIVNTTVDDTQIGLISDGDQVDVTPTGSTQIFGTVASIGLIASDTSDVASFPVVVDVTGTQTGLYPGTEATLSIIYKQLSDVTEVPTAAITTNPTTSQSTVTEVVNGSDVTKDVTIGEAENGETQIVSGLKAGDKVIEKVVSFKGFGGTTGGGGIFGGTGGTGTRRTFTGGGGGFTGGGGGGFTGGGGGFTGAGG